MGGWPLCLYGVKCVLCVFSGGGCMWVLLYVCVCVCVCACVCLLVHVCVFMYICESGVRVCVCAKKRKEEEREIIVSNGSICNLLCTFFFHIHRFLTYGDSYNNPYDRRHRKNLRFLSCLAIRLFPIIGLLLVAC